MINIEILLNGVLNGVRLVLWFLINFEFLLRQTAQFDTCFV